MFFISVVLFMFTKAISFWSLRCMPVCFTLTLFAHKSLIMHSTFYLQESLFYAVPSAAMAMYRLSIESHIMQSEVIKIFWKLWNMFLVFSMLERHTVWQNLERILENDF
jgi:hypothetical protein